MSSHKPDWPLRICLFFIAIILISSVIFLALNLSKTKPSVSSASSPPASPSVCDPPSSGEIFHTTFSSSGLSIPIGAIGPGYYYVKLKDHTSQQEVLSFFLHGKNTVNFNVNSGTYDLYFAHGDSWFGPDLLFGNDTEYMMAKFPITINSSSDSVQIWTPAIIHGEDLVIDTTSIHPSEF